MMKLRLATVAPVVVHALQAAPPEKLRAIALMACELCLHEVDVVDTRLDAGMSMLRDRRLGPSLERDALALLVDELDEQAWNIQDAVEAGQLSQQAYGSAFSRARAVAAVLSALEIDHVLAASDAVYEAYAATGNLDDLTSRVYRVLGA